MQPFLALITPVSGTPGQPPSGGAPGYPTHPWMPPWGPAHPIAPGGPPPGIWGPIGNYPDAGFPGPQPGGPVYPSHPIYYPPVIWGPIGDYIDAGFPGPQPPTEGGGSEQPKVEWKTAWSPTTGWIVVGVPTGEHVTPSGKGSQQSQPKPPEQSGQVTAPPTPPKP